MVTLSQLEHQIVNLVHSIKGDRAIRIDLKSFIDDSDEGDNYETENHFVSYCPYCFETYGYTKKKLYIEKSSMEIGFCHRCHSVYVNYTTDLNFEIISSRVKNHQFSLSKLPKVNLNVGGPDHSIAAYENCKIDREGILNILSNRNLDSINNVGKSILINRNKERYLPLIDKLGMKGGLIDDDHGFIMVPFYINNTLIYWQSKLIGYNIKYFMPPIAHKPFYIPEFKGNKIVIVEGIFDAISCLYLYPDRTPIAILGSHVTDYHIWLLRNYIQPVDCLISLDNIHLSLNTLFQLKGLIPTISNYSLYYGKYDQDPDELLLSLSNSELEEFINTHRYENSFEWE